MLAQPAHAPDGPGSIDPSWLERHLTAGAAITVKAAERHANRTGAARVGPSHLLVALLERPGHQVRAFIQEHGASLTWLSDSALAGIGHIKTLRGPGLDAILNTAHDEARSRGQERADDLCLLLAVLRHGDALSDRLLLEAGLIAAPASTMTVSDLPSQVNALLATPGPFRPRLGAPAWSAPVRQARWLRNTRALIAAIDLSPLFVALICIVVACGALLAGNPTERMVRPLTIGFVVAFWLVSLCLHEFGHAAAAFLTGERRVKDQGYLTLDIRRYTNPLLTFGLPLISLFVGGTPLPGGCVLIAPSAFRTVREERFISAAGPAANLICLVVLSAPLRLGLDHWSPLGVAVSAAASLEVGVIVFNLLPIPPLDGWHIVSAGASPSTKAQAAALGFMPLLALLVLFRAMPELGYAYWDLVDALGAIFGAEWGPAAWGRWMLRLS